MDKKQQILLLIFLLGISFFLNACAQEFQKEPVLCTADAKACPDGSFVSRDPEDNCNFFRCPIAKVCPTDEMLCPDGKTIVSRNPTKNCEFNPCPPPTIDKSTKDWCERDDDCILSDEANECCQIGCSTMPIHRNYQKQLEEERRSVCDRDSDGLWFCPAIAPVPREYCKQRYTVQCLKNKCTLIDNEENKNLSSSKKKCGQYRRSGKVEEYCAVCGDGICETFERCTPSTCDETKCTTDCGPLYCQQDCK